MMLLQYKTLNKTVTVRSFYMDETEITNSEYRQFVDWVKFNNEDGI
jgi:formylglycine-generating enzyme required for sulfatase activity